MIDRRTWRTSAKVSIVLADDQVMFREGLRKMLEQSGQVEVVGAAGDGRQALDLAASLKPQVLVAETALPQLNGLELTRHIVRDLPYIKVVLLSGSGNVDFAPQALKAGAAGLVQKKAEVSELVLAIKAVARGDSYFSSAIAGSILSNYLRLVDQSPNENGLTDREREVLQMIAEGHGNQDIARACFISVKTVEAHKANIMKKLALANRNELLMYAVRSQVGGGELEAGAK